MNQSPSSSWLLSRAPFTLSILLCACAATSEPASAPVASSATTVAATPAQTKTTTPLVGAAATAVKTTTPAVPGPSAALGTPGAVGIGDPLFPKAGNGGYDVQSYDLTLSLDKTDGPIDASEVIRAKSTQALSQFDLDLHALDVHAIEVNGAAATFTRDGDELIITPAKAIANGTEFTTLVKYGGVPEGIDEPALPFGIKIGWISKGGEVYVFSEPTGAKSFMPCNDHPRDKALVTMHITVPKPLKVVSNGTLAETIDGGDKRTFVYKPRDPIATYLITLCIADFAETEIDGPNGMKIHNYFSPKTPEKGRKGFDRAGEVMKFLSDTFGPYPFDTCGNILASVGIPGALETQTLPLYGAGASGEGIMSHEQAHQWFGDAVSVANWQDIWLNEGFAEYASWMYTESSKGREAFDKEVRVQYGAQRANGAPRPPPANGDANAKDKPKRRLEPPPGNPTGMTLFSSSVYVRGALSLNALRTEVGDEAFLKVMRTWVEKHKNGNASVADFLNHVEQTTTPAARAVLEHWVMDEEMPHVAAWDEQLAKDKVERDAKRKERDEKKAKEKADKEKAEEDAKKVEKKDG